MHNLRLHHGSSVDVRDHYVPEPEQLPRDNRASSPKLHRPWTFNPPLLLFSQPICAAISLGCGKRQERPRARHPSLQWRGWQKQILDLVRAAFQPRHREIGSDKRESHWNRIKSFISILLSKRNSFLRHLRAFSPLYDWLAWFQQRRSKWGSLHLRRRTPSWRLSSLYSTGIVSIWSSEYKLLRI
jgi:hypothetical protein